VLKQNLHSPLGAFDTITIIKNGLKMRKLRPPKIMRVKNSKKETAAH
jgi:hypothetical protein